MMNWMICPVCGQPFDSALGQCLPGSLPLCPECFKRKSTARPEGDFKRS